MIALLFLPPALTYVSSTSQMVIHARNVFRIIGALALLPFFATASEISAPVERSSASLDRAGTVTGLPYSTQWIYERTSSFVYLSYNSAQMQDSTLGIDHYLADFGDKNFGYPAFDLFNHIVSFGDPESRSPWREISLWGRYSLGFANRKGNLSDSRVAIDPNLEKSSLFIFSTRIGALLSCDHWDSFKPYAGIEISPYFFRQSADISGAEQQGASYSYGPVVGAHLPLLFSGKASILTEYRHSTAGNGSRIFGSMGAFSAGLGLAL